MIHLVMGKPGVGKSTYSALVARRYIKKGIKVYSTHHILGTYKLDINWIGKYMLEECVLIIDEAQLIYDNRAFKTFRDEWKEFYSQHRHYKVEIYLLSQSFEDLDVKLRRLSQRIYIIQPTIFGLTHIKIQRVRMRFNVNEDKTDIVTTYEINPLNTRYKRKRPAWKYFDSFERKQLEKIPNEQLWGQLQKRDLNYYKQKYINYYIKAKTSIKELKLNRKKKQKEQIPDIGKEQQ